MKTLDIKAFAVRDDSGKIDHFTTLEKFGKVLIEYEKTREAELNKIHDAVHAVFDKHLGVNINVPALVSLSMQNMTGVALENYGEMADAVKKYIQENAKDDGAFDISKGPRGGVRRLCDIVAPAAPEQK